MGNPLYAVRETGLCPACRFPRDSTYHFRLHVPRDRWPASMGKGAPRVEHGPYERAVAFSEYEAVSGEASAPGFRTFPDAADAEVPPSPEAAPTCVCGRVAASNAGLAAHQRHCEQFKAVTNGA